MIPPPLCLNDYDDESHVQDKDDAEMSGEDQEDTDEKFVENPQPMEVPQPTEVSQTEVVVSKVESQKLLLDLDDVDESYVQDEDDAEMSEEDKEDTKKKFVESPQPTEVAQTEVVVSTVGNLDPASSKFTWKIENFSRLNPKEKHHYSDVFTAGDSKWRVVMFPKGNNVDYLSMYLSVADPDDLPYGWSRCAQFSLSVVNQINNEDTVRNDALPMKFTARRSNCGSSNIMPLSELYDLSRGYLVDDTCIVETEVMIREDDWTYDSRIETGYVGLKNQGATCYLNSLLQTLYHIPNFRKAVYHMPTTENDFASGSSIPLALQILFYKLQYSKDSVGTKELTKSFGWNTHQSFTQHDVQELNRVLCENLENKMKGTAVEGTIQHLFEGHHMNYVECINVDYKSTRKESFYDIQLDVKGYKDVYASFDKYVEVERLEGDNKYHADQQHGLQDAKKGVLFIDFPPVLQLHLKRYEYNIKRDTMVKINDRYEFPLQLDLDREDGKYLSPDADKNVRNLYTLQAILAHSGGGHSGHYYALIRPTVSKQWFKFNDEMVTKEDIKQVLEEQYGGEARYSNAYMLVYIRESNRDEIICNVDEKDIAEHLRIRLKKEQEEKERKKKDEKDAHLYTIIKVARHEDLLKQIGRDIYFDLVDHEKVSSFRIQKKMPFNIFKEEVAKEFGVPGQFQRFWLWTKRGYDSYRPDRPLTLQEETQSVGQLSQFSYKADGRADLKLFLEIEIGTEFHPVPPPCYWRHEDILLFFKLYDAEKEEIRYVGRLFVKWSGKPLEILKKLNEMAGFFPDDEIELYKELSFAPTAKCKQLDKNLTFSASRLMDGDIICFQKPASADSLTQCRCPDVTSFLEDVSNRRNVHFRSLEKPMEDDFCLELSKVLKYDDITDRVALHLCLDDPTKIRLFRHNHYYQRKQEAIRYQGFDHLSEVLIQFGRTTDIMYYEVLDIPLPELEELITLNVAFLLSTKNETVVHSIRLPKQSTVGDLINDLKKKVELSRPDVELRLLVVTYHKIGKILPLSEKIENIDQYWKLRAEEILEEEKNLGPKDLLIHVYHFTKGVYHEQFFGEPFFLVIHEGETLHAVKLRIQKKLQVPDEQFSKWKFTFPSWMGRLEYLKDSDIVSKCFQRRSYFGVTYYFGPRDRFLGLEHSDSSPKRKYAATESLKIG
ncbi:ubiquitin carboxyl-terminal hydrolase 13-like [Papaver somniferum]|uniref:ubiquitin carboxyl-terminal hydrolase 13-like n=1 Tax=Papaver somniferum TaxID=3469 RepID=UPI000E6FD153|nr:ubiquitin carboxyl-terminal hydrolase 13-like [Papaver somniferum]